MEVGKLLSIRQIAAKWRVSRASVQKWIAQERLVPIVIDGRPYLPSSTRRPKPVKYGELAAKGKGVGDLWPK